MLLKVGGGGRGGSGCVDELGGDALHGSEENRCQGLHGLTLCHYYICHPLPCPPPPREHGFDEGDPTCSIRGC